MAIFKLKSGKIKNFKAGEVIPKDAVPYDPMKRIEETNKELDTEEGFLPTESDANTVKAKSSPKETGEAPGFIEGLKEGAEDAVEGVKSVGEKVKEVLTGKPKSKKATPEVTPETTPQEVPELPDTLDSIGNQKEQVRKAPIPDDIGNRAYDVETPAQKEVDGNTLEFLSADELDSKLAQAKVEAQKDPMMQSEVQQIENQIQKNINEEKGLPKDNPLLSIPEKPKKEEIPAAKEEVEEPAQAPLPNSRKPEAVLKFLQAQAKMKGISKLDKLNYEKQAADLNMALFKEDKQKIAELLDKFNGVEPARSKATEEVTSVLKPGELNIPFNEKVSPNKDVTPEEVLEPKKSGTGKKVAAGAAATGAGIAGISAALSEGENPLPSIPSKNRPEDNLTSQQKDKLSQIRQMKKAGKKLNAAALRLLNKYGE